jgi:predicted dehydrogenase
MIQRGDETIRHETARVFTIDAELKAFAEAIRSGGPNPNPPNEALQDLAVMEAIITSADRKQPVMVEQVLDAANG